MKRAFLLALPLLLAACVENPGVNVPTDGTLDLNFVNPVMLDHEHSDLSLHHINNNFHLIGRSLLGEDGPPGYPGEIDVVGDLAFVALLGYGFGIVDVSDPTNPTLIGLEQSPSVDGFPCLPSPVGCSFGRYAADIKADATGDWAFLALHASPTPGLLIYDTRDKADPKLAGVWVEPSIISTGCHMVEYGIIGGEEYIFCAPLDNGIHVGKLLPPTQAGAREVVTVARFNLHNQQTINGIVEKPGPPEVLKTLSGHDDMTLQPDPLTGEPILVVSAWELGVRLVDISNPMLPVELGSWVGADAEYYRGNIHTAMAFKSGDRRIVVAIPEVANPPAVFVLDATDLNDIKTVAEWLAVPDFGKEPYTFSMHNFQVVDEKVYLAMYHAGIWVLDLSTPETPTPVASYMPSEPRADGADYSVGAWDVVVWNGFTLTADVNGGFYVLHHAADPAGDPAYTSFA